MKNLRIAVVTAMFAAGVSVPAAASPATDLGEQWFNAKYGRSSPMYEVRLNVEQANTAYREEAATQGAWTAANAVELYFKAKWGRSSPVEEARRKAEQENTAFRDETDASGTGPLGSHAKTKLGRTSREEERRSR